MNDKLYTAIFCFVGCIVVILFAVFIGGCRSTPKVGATELASAGYREIGRLEQLDKELDRISKSARSELSRAGDSTLQLGDIVSRVFNIAFGLCDEIDKLRAELNAIKDSEFVAEHNTGNPYLD
jgi:hypothetical protein